MSTHYLNITGRGLKGLQCQHQQGGPMMTLMLMYINIPAWGVRYPDEAAV
ncbi:MAG: hypothetical protein NTY50_01100 [Methylobacter sp.]|nr:hypothetical protein [Methylobacter sp.]